MTRSFLLQKGTILNKRYRITQQLGRGGFGRTYLAENIYRYRELCVLKEFAPQVESDLELYKAEELFEREASILYELECDRIPKFEALLRTRIDDKKTLFLVQEYIAGETYGDLLEKEKQLSETEVTQAILDLLPVLQYIHNKNLIHRDISPDNLIKRDADGKPVLIDFGCVKLAAEAVSQSTAKFITLTGKKGYSPEEQLQQGKAFPNSDLYSLAATAVVLLTGKKPEELYDKNLGKWHWESHVKISSHLTKVLEKMLAYHSGDRYQTAKEVRQALTANNSLINSFISRVKTLVVAPGSKEYSNFNPPVNKVFQEINSDISSINTEAISASPATIESSSPEKSNRIKVWHWGMITAAVILLPGLISFTIVRNKILPENETFSYTEDPLSKRELKQQQKINNRLQKSKQNPASFYRKVDQIFHTRYPELKGQQLQDTKEHKKYRQIWYRIANSLLERLENK